MTDGRDREPGQGVDLPSPVDWSPDGDAVLLLDQTLLPAQERVLRLETVEEVAEAILSMRVRGAPAVGIAAAFGAAVALQRIGRQSPDLDGQGIARAFEGVVNTLRSTRPTAVNLAWALDRVSAAFHGAAPGGLVAQINAVRREADAIAREEEAMCRAIGETGLLVIPEEGASVLTHCNAGALATGGAGTALAPVLLAHRAGIDIRVFADETRPLLQGSRLTAWELERAGIPVTLVTDSMAGALMGSGQVDMVIVGADRVAANGDVANKIGTYSLAILAEHHGIPFYVAVPRSTFDLDAKDGRQIPIEVRDALEVTEIAGTPVAPAGVAAWNPAFDVTPAHLVTAFVTDRGILRPPYPQAISSLFSSPSETRR